MSQGADVLTLKRSHSPERHHPLRSYTYPLQHQRSRSLAASLDRRAPTGHCLPLTQARGLAVQKCSMPLQTASRPLAETMPSFMTVYGQDSEETSYATSISPTDAFSDRHRINNSFEGQDSLPNSAGTSYATFRQYQSAFPNSPTESIDSPTTTASLADSSASSIVTPGSTPNTPASIQSLSFNSALSMRPSSSSKAEPRGLGTPPIKKARNLKNLAVNTSSTFPLGRAANTATFPMHPTTDSNSSSPSLFSPTIIRPIQPPKKRSTNLGLTIATPSTESRPIEQVGNDVPPTPAQVRPAALRHFQSTPSLPIFSATLPPTGGMRLPDIPSGRPVASFDSILSETEEDGQLSNYDLPQSQEEKPDAYPQGPICIYDPHVYLYFEPTAQQAAEYDVIFNVASEVKNPFSGEAAYPINVVTLEQAFEQLFEQHESSPSTPKANEPPKDSVERPSVEYIHVPWEHNTDIVKDLYTLVKVVDDRVQRGKRVLIHCQCGVSRSASLVVAYGIYKNPDVTVQDAYDAVKKRSEWIGPNMNLIMQLQEFRSGLRRGEAAKINPNTLLKPGKGFQNRSSSSANRAKPEDSPDGAAPQTAPLVPSPIRTDSLDKVAPGPSSAPSNLHWPSGQRETSDDAPLPSESGMQMNSEAPIVNPTGQVLQTITLPKSQPIKAKDNKLAIQTFQGPSDLRMVTGAAQSPLETARSAEFGMSSVQPRDLDDTLGITSPRAAQFSHSPTEQLLQDQTPLLSPRGEEFGMSAFNPPEQDHTFGLTSPRATTFTAQIPHRVQQQQEFPGFSAILPDEDAHGFLARAELRSQLGMTSRSNTNMRAAYALHEQTPATKPQESSLLAAKPQEISVPDTSALSDALMSPRASEFTMNPFDGPSLHQSTTSSAMEEDGGGGDVTPKPQDEDPRSPPIKGAQPIVRNIFDVL